MGLIDYFCRFGRSKVKLSETPSYDSVDCASHLILGSVPDAAMSLSAVFACTRRISETIGALPCQIYKRDGGNGKIPAPEHRLYRILHNAPNADMTTMTYYERVALDLCLHGNHFSEIYRNDESQVISIYPLRPDLVSKTREFNSPAFVYKYADPNGAYRIIPEENMLYIPGFAYDVELGLSLSPIEASRRTIENAFAADGVATGMFKNGIAPSGLLSTERTLDDKQRKDLRQMMVDQAGALKKAGGLMVVESGMNYTPLTIKPVDAQVLESRLYSVEEVCTIFGVPPHMIGHTTKSTSWGSGLEEQNLWFVTYTVKPYLERIEMAVTNKLLGPIEIGRYIVEFNLDGLLRANSSGRAAYYSTALQNGWMSRNEVRQRENMSSIPGGETHTVQVNLVPLDQLGQSVQPGGEVENEKQV